MPAVAGLAVPSRCSGGRGGRGPSGRGIGRAGSVGAGRDRRRSVAAARVRGGGGSLSMRRSVASGIRPVGGCMPGRGQGDGGVRGPGGVPGPCGRRGGNGSRAPVPSVVLSVIDRLPHRINGRPVGPVACSLPNPIVRIVHYLRQAEPGYPQACGASMASHPGIWHYLLIATDKPDSHYPHHRLSDSQDHCSTAHLM